MVEATATGFAARWLGRALIDADLRRRRYHHPALINALEPA